MYSVICGLAQTELKQKKKGFKGGKTKSCDTDCCRLADRLI